MDRGNLLCKRSKQTTLRGAGLAWGVRAAEGELGVACERCESSGEAGACSLHEGGQLFVKGRGADELRSGGHEGGEHVEETAARQQRLEK